MGSVQCVYFLLTILLFLITVYLVETNGTRVETAENPEILGNPEMAENSDKTSESANFNGLSAEAFKEAVKLINESKLYNKIQDVLVHYVQHFAMYGKMTMRTKSGRITVPISEKIERALAIMVKHVLHVELTSIATKNSTFDFTNQINKFRFIRNNTVLLDKIIKHTEAAFKVHGDIENPEKLRFYHPLKGDARFFKIEHLNQCMKDIIQIQKDASIDFLDLATGRIFGIKSSELNSDECLHIGDYATTDDVEHSVQFYEAAVKRLDIHKLSMINKSQILERIINFYSQYGPECENRVAKLQGKLEKVIAEESENATLAAAAAAAAAADDDDDDDDAKEEDELIKDTNANKNGEKDGKTKQQKNNENNKIETAEANEANVEEKSGPASDDLDSSDETGDKDISDGFDDINDKVDENDELCFRKIMKKSSILSTHDEL